jgi:hypothetical protein
VNLYGMLPILKPFFVSIQTPELPSGSQAILDKNNKLIAYHIRTNPHDEVVQFELYNFYKKRLATCIFSPMPYIIYETTSNSYEIPLITEWSRTLAKLFPRERNSEEYRYDARVLLPAQKEHTETDILKDPLKPLVLDFEQSMINKMRLAIKNITNR